MGCVCNKKKKKNQFEADKKLYVARSPYVCWLPQKERKPISHKYKSKDDNVRMCRIERDLSGVKSRANNVQYEVTNLMSDIEDIVHEYSDMESCNLSIRRSSRSSLQYLFQISRSQSLNQADEDLAESDEFYKRHDVFWGSKKPYNKENTAINVLDLESRHISLSSLSEFQPHPNIHNEVLSIVTVEDNDALDYGNVTFWTPIDNDALWDQIYGAYKAAVSGSSINVLSEELRVEETMRSIYEGDELTHPVDEEDEFRSLSYDNEDDDIRSVK